MKNNTFVHDLFLIIPLLIIACVCLVFNLTDREIGEFVRVEVNGQVIGEYSLQENAEYKLNGGTNTLVIREGSAWISEADCSDKTCVKQGKIKYSGQSIVCLPNKISVMVIQKKGDVDLVI